MLAYANPPHPLLFPPQIPTHTYLLVLLYSKGMDLWSYRLRQCVWLYVSCLFLACLFQKSFLGLGQKLGQHPN